MASHCVIIPGNTDLNRGDQALVWESIRVVRDAGFGGNFYLLNSGENKDDIDKQSRQTIQLGHKFIMPILRHPSRICKDTDYLYTKKQYLLWSIRSVIDAIQTFPLLCASTLIKLVRDRFNTGDIDNNSLEILSQASAVIVKGGGFLHSYGGITATYQMYYSVFHILLAIRMNKPVIIMPNSFGPFAGMLVPELIKLSLGKSSFVSARETISARQLTNLLNKKIEVYPDLGFFLKPANREVCRHRLLKMGVPLGKKKCVGITVRPYRFPTSANPVKEYKNYIRSIAQFINWLSVEGYHIVLVSHTIGPSVHENDYKAISDVMKECAQDGITVVHDDELNCRDLMALYGLLDFTVGTRFHSVIFSLAQGVPSLAISYGGNKAAGIMNDVGLEEYVIPIEQIDADSLINKFNTLVNNYSRASNVMTGFMDQAKYNREKLIHKIQAIM